MNFVINYGEFLLYNGFIILMVDFFWDVFDDEEVWVDILDISNMKEFFFVLSV